jgi:alanyl-tRNA synthetase
MKTAEIRTAFLQFFEERGHRVVPSGPLVPPNDPTLLFTNAGMVQFKDALAGREDRGYQRATSAQLCIRAGGKHNDLENVGYTARHNTFFEMLGNFSFGDYFKEDAIRWGWEFVTGVLGIDRDRLWISVHESDDEAEKLWHEMIGVPMARIVRLGDADNFWAMGDTGPCGPCTEMFYDHGPNVAGGPPGSADEDGDRYIEFWNLVFPQYDRQPDGRLEPLPKPGVDTGLGLERVAAILQGVHSIYEIDSFRKLMRVAGRLAGIRGDVKILANPSLRVIADHIRSSAFLIADGVLPDRAGRGYVVRRIIRRALRHGRHKLGIDEPFFHRLLDPLIEDLGEAYPFIVAARERVIEVLQSEEEQFERTLGQGMSILEEAIEGLEGSVIPGEVVFKLYDTYGFPVDLTADVARERNLTVDMDGFDTAMQRQQEQSHASSRFGVVTREPVVEGSTTFTGYEGVTGEATVTDLFRVSGEATEATRSLSKGESGIVVLDRTPFYAEAGGQVGDTGRIFGARVEFRVIDTRPGGEQHLHHGELVRGKLSVGDRVSTEVDEERRRAIMLNHSATHLLHAALRTVLGQHVEQKGSLVAPDRLRFDFSHTSPVSDAELDEIERMVNEQIRRNTEVSTNVLPFEEAIARGAMALFGEKYAEDVRVLTMGEGFSVELCGGTHVRRTGDIGCLRIVSEQGIAAGIRRIEALTGQAALDAVHADAAAIRAIGQLVRGGNRSEVLKKVRQILEQNRELGRTIEQLQARLATSTGSDLADDARSVDGIKVLGAELSAVDPKSMLSTLDMLKSRLGSAVIVLATVSEGKVSLIAGVTKDVTDRIQAGEVLKMVGDQVGARGGGRADMARAGGGDKPEALAGALAGLEAWVAARVRDA